MYLIEKLPYELNFHSLSKLWLIFKRLANLEDTAIERLKYNSRLPIIRFIDYRDDLVSKIEEFKYDRELKMDFLENRVNTGSFAYVEGTDCLIFGMYKSHQINQSYYSLLDFTIGENGVMFL